ncbi:phage tail tape measure protein [Nocardia abscessus]|uniref:phage tail tape measure protein n=1 Tax=Nocardia abscessus TaxID=120957 RepID=UPI002454EF8D|nr:phage tail tape measure protein [Nocardia abscessus]
MAEEGVNVGSIYAELTIDDTRFQQRLQSSEQGFTSLRTAATRAASEVDQSFRGTGAQIARTGDEARDAANDLGRVGNAAQEVSRDVRRVADASEEAARATHRIEIPAELARSAERAQEAVAGIGDAAASNDGAGSAMGDNFLGGFTEKIKGLGGKGGPIAMALVGVAGIGLAAGAALVGAIADGMQQERQRDLIQARLGVNEQAMKIYGAAAGAAFSNGWGESVNANLETVQAAMGGGLLNGEESAAEMQPVIEKLTAVNDLLGGDMAQTISATRALMLNGLAPDANTAFDLIVKASQRGSNAGDDLLESVREYSNGWKQTGFSAQYTLGLINQAMANGVDVADRPADAIREFGRRMSEEGDTIKETLTSLQLPADELFERLKAGGPEAEAAFDQVFDAIRGIEDPLERAAAAQALLGDTAGDFINAFTQWDPSEAAKTMGDYAGSAENAMRVMGSNSAASFEAAKNSITASADDIKLALAEAFGPTLTQAADWVSTHKPEIISFFTGLADAGLACLDGLIAFASGSLRAFASLQEGIGDTIGKALGYLGGFAKEVGGILKHIPGMEETGAAIEGVGASVQWYGEQTDAAADRARAMADVLDSARPKIDGIRESVRLAGETASGAAEMTRLFGGAVTAVPDGKSVLVQALTEDARQRLTDFGFQVETLPDGNSRVTADTAEGQRLIDAFVEQNNGRNIPVTVTPEVAREALGPLAGLYVPDQQRADGGIDLDRYANGKLPDQATIKAATPNLVQWAEPETGGEAFIPLAAGKRARSLDILAAVADRFGYGLLQMADGGLTADELSAQSRGIEGARYVWGGWDESWNTDCSGAVSKVANMAAYGDPMTGGRFATGNMDSALSSRGFLPGAGPDGSVRVGWIHDPNMPGGGHAAATLPDGTNVEMGGERGNGQFGGQAAGWSDFPAVMHYPMPGSVGAGTSRKYNAKAEDFNAENDPDGLKALTEAGDFTDRFGKKYGVAEDDPLVSAFLSDAYDAQVDPAKLSAGNDPDGLKALMGAGDFTDRFGKAFGVAEDDPLVDALLDTRDARKKAAEEAKSAAAASTRSLSSSSGGVQDVRVTNWPESLGGQPKEERQPRATVNARFFADGGEDHSAQIAPAGDLRVWGEPETGGEAYIPLGAAKRVRSLALLRRVADRFGFGITPYAAGGFGGLGSAGDGGVHTGSWKVAALGEQGDIPLSTPSRDVPGANLGAGLYRLASFGVGAALAAASGWDKDGKFVGFDTSNTSIPGLEDGLGRLSEQLTVLIEAVRDGKPVNVDVDIDAGRRTADLKITQLGV